LTKEWKNKLKVYIISMEALRSTTLKPDKIIYHIVINVTILNFIDL